MCAICSMIFLKPGKPSTRPTAPSMPWLLNVPRPTLEQGLFSQDARTSSRPPKLTTRPLHRFSIVLSALQMKSAESDENFRFCNSAHDAFRVFDDVDTPATAFVRGAASSADFRHPADVGLYIVDLAAAGDDCRTKINTIRGLADK